MDSEESIRDGGKDSVTYTDDFRWEKDIGPRTGRSGSVSRVSVLTEE